MAQTFTSLAELARINDVSLKDFGIDNLFHSAPLIEALHTIPASAGTVHKYLRRNSAPTVGFRPIGDGLDRSFGGSEAITIDLKYEDADYICDVAEVRGFARGGKEEYIAKGVANMLQEALYKLDKQVIYGTAALGDTAGFTGLAQATASLGGMVIGAGSASANAVTSVYGIRTGSDADVAFVVGNSGEIDVSETTLTQVIGANSKPLAAYLTSIGTWGGLQIGGTKSVGRLANIGASANKLTDALLAQLYSVFPANGKPDFWLMNSASLAQLQASRTATSPTGAPAPFPTDSFGVKIVVDDAIVSTEPVVS